MSKHVDSMTIDEFKALPVLANQSIVCRSLVIVPQEKIHPSGYRCMSFVAVDATGFPIGQFRSNNDKSSYDVLNMIDTNGELDAISLDVLSGSGLCRVFSMLCNIEIIFGSFYSSSSWFEIKTTKQ